MNDTKDSVARLLSFEPEKPRTAPERHRAATRKRLMDAWRELFLSKSGMTTPVAEIARKAEVAPATFYLHFKGKEDLTREAALESNVKLLREVEQVGMPTAGTIEERTRGTVEVLLDFAENHPQEYRFMYSLGSLGDSEGFEFTRLWQSVWLEYAEQRIRALAAEGHMRKSIDPTVGARAIEAMYVGVLMWWSEDTSRAPREAVMETLLEMTLTLLVEGTPSQGSGDSGSS